MFQVTYNYFLIPRVEINIKQLFNITREILGLRRALISIETLRVLNLLKDYIYYEVIRQV